MASVKAVATGPLFDGTAQKDVSKMIIAMEEAVAQDILNTIQTRLDGVLKNPTGYYESQTHTERRADNFIVDDNGVVYGPWLEGTSSRNQNTRFKGYMTFRKTTQEYQTKAGPVAENAAKPYIKDMN